MPTSIYNAEANVLNNKFYAFPSPAKLNLFLHIVGRRADGYHELETLFQFLDYGDTIEIKPTVEHDIVLLTPVSGVENDDNLIIKAARLLQEHGRKHQNPSQNTRLLGAQIKVNKVLPMGGGLGGGSSNAATILLALNTLWQLNLSINELAELGVSLGADVPIFIHGFSAFAQGIGEKLTPTQPYEYWYLVSKPEVSISTESIFISPDLKRDTKKLNIANINIELCTNDCQPLVIKSYPEVANLLSWLVEYAPSRMTGTGACIFSRFDSEQEARQIQSLLPKNVVSFVAKGVNQSPLTLALSKLELT